MLLNETEVSCDNSLKKRKHNSPFRATGRMPGFDQEAADRAWVALRPRLLMEFL